MKKKYMLFPENIGQISHSSQFMKRFTVKSKVAFTAIIILFACLFQGSLYAQDNTSLGTDALSQSQTVKYPISSIQITNPGSYSLPIVNWNVSAPFELYGDQYFALYSDGFNYDATIRSTTDLGNVAPTFSGGSGDHSGITVDIGSWQSGGYYYYSVSAWDENGGGYAPKITLSSTTGNSYSLFSELDPNGELNIYYSDDKRSNLYATAPSVTVEFGGATAIAILSETVANHGNTAIGFESQKLSPGSTNTSVGAYSLKSNTTGSSNSVLGYKALTANTTGSFNVAIGYQALSSNTTGNLNMGIGFSALSSNSTGVSNQALGYNALMANTTGNNNLAIGRGALQVNTSGIYNLAIGNASLDANTTGLMNLAIGVSSLTDNSTGEGNTAIGHGAGIVLTTGNNNTLIGKNANLSAATVSNTVAITDGLGSHRFYSPASGNVILGRGNNPSDDGYRLDVGGTGRFSGTVTLAATPAASTSGYEVLTRNTSTGEIEKADLTFSNLVNIDQNQEISGNKFFMGSIGIGTSTPSGKLAVNGTIVAKAVKVDPNPSSWPDYVFDSKYSLPSLQSISEFIKENGHLPEIPSAAQVAKEGIELGTLGASLLKKIEELTLHLIQKDKELIDANRRIDELAKQIENIKH